jgi:hypothetical protein
MSGHHFDMNAYIDPIRTRTVPSSVRGAALAAIGVGVLGFGYGMVASPVWAWGALLVAIVWTLGMAQGGVMFSVVSTLTWARWSRPLKRIGEAYAFTFPLVWLALLVFLVAGNSIYPWHEGTVIEGGAVPLAPHADGAWATKETWLSLPFFIARQLLGIGFMMALSFMYVRSSLRPDLIAAKQRLGNDAPGWWGSFIGGAGSVDVEADRSMKTQATLGVLLAVTYALVMSFMAFDLVMSLSPWFYTNMFGGWIFASSFWIACASIGIIALLGRDWLGLRALVKPNVMHDLGKICLAFCMFWAYTTFAQVLPIWYANMPEETDFLLVRMTLPQWSWLARTVAVLCFLTPFTVLLSRGIKKMKWPFVALLSLILTGIFLERTLLVMPSIWWEDTFPWHLFLGVSVPVWFGAIGAFTFVVTTILAKVPAVPITDEKLQPHPWDVHVHSLDGHGHASEGAHH